MGDYCPDISPSYFIISPLYIFWLLSHYVCWFSPYSCWVGCQSCWWSHLSHHVCWWSQFHMPLSHENLPGSIPKAPPQPLELASTRPPGQIPGEWIRTLEMILASNLSTISVRTYAKDRQKQSESSQYCVCSQWKDQSNSMITIYKDMSFCDSTLAAS